MGDGSLKTDLKVKLDQHNLVMIGIGIACLTTFILLVVKISKQNG